MTERIQHISSRLLSCCLVYEDTLKVPLKGIACCVFILLPLFAQGKGGEGYRKFDNAIRRFLMSGLDTTYIACSPNSWEIPFVNNVYGNTYRLGTTNGGDYPYISGVSHEIGIGIGYHGLDFIYTIPFGDNQISNYFEFDYFDNYWGAQLIISGNSTTGSGLSYSSTTIGGYFAFNGKRFSYPATYYGNYRQLKSAGSPMIVLWYDHLHYWNTDESAPVINEDADVDNVSLCGGYAYNWALLDGNLSFNLGGAVGVMAPFWGLAAQAKGCVMYWICDYFRLNLASTVFFEQGKRTSDNLAVQRSEWSISIGMAVCLDHPNRQKKKAAAVQ